MSLRYCVPVVSYIHVMPSGDEKIYPLPSCLYPTPTNFVPDHAIAFRPLSCPGVGAVHVMPLDDVTIMFELPTATNVVPDHATSKRKSVLLFPQKLRTPHVVPSVDV